MKLNKFYRKTYLIAVLFIVFAFGFAFGFFVEHWGSISYKWTDSILKSDGLSHSNPLLSYLKGNQNTEGFTRIIARLKNENALKDLQLSFLKSMIDLNTGEGRPFREMIDMHIESLGLSSNDLFPILNNYLDLKTDTSQPSPNLKEVASRLAEIAAENILYPLPAESTAGNTYSPVYFSSLVDPENPEGHLQDDFFEDDVKIYASFDTRDYPEKFVLVKWYKTDSPDLLLFGKYPINKNKAHNYVWLKKPKGWLQGRYAVEIYSVNLNNNLRPIARGSYNVW